MGFFGNLKNKRKNNEIDKMVSDMYTSSSTPESEAQLIQTFKKSGFSQEQTADAIKQLHNINSDFSDKTTVSQQQLNSVVNNMTSELSGFYDLLKSLLVPLENLWAKCNNNSKHTLLYLLKNDIISLVAFLNALNGEIEEYSVNFINIICRSDNQNINADTLYSFAQSMNLSEIIRTKQVSDAMLWKVSAFAECDTSIIQAFHIMGLPQNVSADTISYFDSNGNIQNTETIFQFYALLLMSISNTIDMNQTSNLFYTGLYSYLRHQFFAIGLVTEVPPECKNYLKIIDKKAKFKL